MGRRLDYYEAKMAERAGDLSRRPRRILRNVVITLVTATALGVAASLIVNRESSGPTPLPDGTPPATTPDTTVKPTSHAEGLYPLTRARGERI